MKKMKKQNIYLLKTMMLTLGLFLMGSKMSAQCQANFSDSACVNGTKYFKNTSTGTNMNTQFFWSFGDNAVSNSQNPVHTYTANGTYTVCFKIVNTTPVCVDSICKVVTINCINTGSCQANFKDSTCTNTTMQFWNLSTGTSSTTVYSWNFGDGSPLNNQLNPAHTFSANGMYYVCLTITDSISNCNNTKCDTIYINSNYCTTTGLSKIQLNHLDFKIYPNPNSTGIFSIVEGNTTNLKEPTVIIYNMFGQEMYHESLRNRQTIDASFLTPGTYFIKIADQNLQKTQKLIITK